MKQLLLFLVACAVICKDGVAVKIGLRFGATSGTLSDLNSCPAGATLSACPVGRSVCDGAVCDANPNAICTAKTCTSSSDGQLCLAEWRDPETGAAVDCGWNHIDEIHQCGPHAVHGHCPSVETVCDGAVCPSDPSATCTVRTCTGLYRGQYLDVSCQPIWYSKKTGNLVDCHCSACGHEYEPVCGRDGKTYPNRCLADCLGVPVVKEGKCKRCSGEDCKFGTKGDVCVLDSNQCMEPAFTCLAARDAGAAKAIVGRCLPQQAKNLQGMKGRGLRHRAFLRINSL